MPAVTFIIPELLFFLVLKRIFIKQCFINQKPDSMEKESPP